MKHTLKTSLNTALIGGLLFAQFATAVVPPSYAQAVVTPAVGASPAALPILADFETGGVGSWFDYGDWGNGAALTKTVVLTNTLATLNAVSNTVMQVDYVAAGWGVGVGKDTIPFQDWSAYDGFGFWFYGSGSNTIFKIILTDNAGERLATKFTDNFSGWRELTFPWQVFYHDPDFQPGGAPNDGPTLTAVEAFAFAPTAPSIGRYYMDQVKLFKTTTSVVADFQTGGVGSWFDYGDWGNGAALTKTVVLTNALAALNAVSDTVMKVDYVAAGWGVGVGRDTIPFQDWSAADGLGFWFYGSGSNTLFKIIITDNGGERLATKFTDNFIGWRELNFPWQVFYHDPDFQPGGAPNDGPTLTAVEAFAFAPTAPSTGSYYMDQVKLFKTTTSVVADFQTGGVGSWFDYGDWGNGAALTKTVVLTNSLAALSVVSNTVMQVDYVAAGWGVGVGRDTIPFQDWSIADGLGFWFYGSGSNTLFKIIITDNGGERLATKFTDNFSGWRELTFPWQVFYHDPDFQPGGAPNDGPTLTAVEAFAFAPTAPSMGKYYMEQVRLFGLPATAPVVKADFSNSTYQVNQGFTATLPVVLTAAPVTTFTVNYATSNGTAIAGTHYISTTGTLTFTPGVTTATFSVVTLPNAQYGPDKTVILTLSNPVGGGLGVLHNPATLVIVNTNLPPNTLLIENFEGGLITGRDLFNNQLGFSTWGSTNGNVAITVTTGMTYPTSPLTNTVLRVTSNIENWGGFTDALKEGNDWGKQDWSRYDGLRFWFYGTNSGSQVQVEIFDNRQLENLGDSAERYYQRFADNFSGWRQIALPFALFQRRTDYQPSGAPADGLNLMDVSGFAFNLPAVAATTIYYVDQVELYGDLSQHPATVRAGFSAYGYGAIEGQPLTAALMLNTPAATPITVTYEVSATTAQPTLDYVGNGLYTGTVTFGPGQTTKPITLTTVDDQRVEGQEFLKTRILTVTGAPLGYVEKTLWVIVDNDSPDPTIIDDFENGVPPTLMPYGNVTVTTVSILNTSPIAVPGQDVVNNVLSVTYDIPVGMSGGFVRQFESPRNLSTAAGVNFWYYGRGSGQTLTMTLLDNGQPDPGPTQWTLAWSDEFSGSVGAAPNPANWSHDIGGWGWGNNEWEYYTDSRANSALNGNGQLVITAMTNTNPALTCASSPTGPNGTCFATSARLLSLGKQEFTHGRIEARLRIPKGQGIWPAFWMLGNDIYTTNPWPNSGEIDIMENIGKPAEQSIVHGTLHGPGYAGGSGIGGAYDITPTILADDYHLYAIEWEPDRIRWFLDNTNYFTVTRSQIPAGTDWVFDHPFFILLNVAVGGNWPGYPDGTTLFPQQMAVDYVRVYQAPDTAERFEATFVDSTVGWRKVTLPFNTFRRSATQPANAPNDGLTLTQAQGYGIDLTNSPAAPNAPTNTTGAFYLDDVRLVTHKLYLPLIRR